MTDTMQETIIKVAASSRPTLVAGAIAGVIRKQGCAEVYAFGAMAVNQTVKSIAIAQRYMAEENVHVSFRSHFVELSVDGQPYAALHFQVKGTPEQVDSVNSTPSD